MITLEIACNNFQSCLNAQAGGANRIELFENLPEGGCTPSFGMIKHVLQSVQIPVYVMIRCRGGHFHYIEPEIELMLEDVQQCKLLGVAGIVFGALTKAGEVDILTCKRIIRAWDGKATFHRAFDRLVNREQSVPKIIELGFERILTSGGKASAPEGAKEIHLLNEQFGKQIQFMAGAGVLPSNAAQVLKESGVKQVHATCKQNVVTNDIWSDVFSVSDLSKIQALRAAIDE